MWLIASDCSLSYNVAGWSPSGWWRLRPLMQLQFSFHNCNPWQIATTSLSSIIFRQILLEGREKEALQRYGNAPNHLQSFVQVRKDWATSWWEQIRVLSKTTYRECTSWWEQFRVLLKTTYRERYRDYFDNL